MPRQRRSQLTREWNHESALAIPASHAHGRGRPRGACLMVWGEMDAHTHAYARHPARRLLAGRGQTGPGSQSTDLRQQVACPVRRQDPLGFYGSVDVAGLTESQARDKIADYLRPFLAVTFKTVPSRSRRCMGADLLRLVTSSSSRNEVDPRTTPRSVTSTLLTTEVPSTR